MWTTCRMRSTQDMACSTGVRSIPAMLAMLAVPALPALPTRYSSCFAWCMLESLSGIPHLHARSVIDARSFPSTWTLGAYRFEPAMMTDPVPANQQIPSNQQITNNQIIKSANHCIIENGRLANHQRIRINDAAPIRPRTPL